MTTQTRFRIYYIDPITAENNLLNFREPNAVVTTEKTATLNVGSRTHTDLAVEIQRALNDAGEETYSVVFNRSSRTFTISAGDTFELLAATGSNSGQSAYSLIGFTTDQTGASTYEGSAAGNDFQSQFFPQNYLSFDDNLEGTEASVNQAPSGITETVTFGDIRLMEFNMSFVTSQFKSKGNPIRYNATGLEDARSLMEFLIKKRFAEFMLDESDVNTFDKVLLERTPESRQGIAYRLKEQIGRGFSEHYETGRLVFRKIE